MTIPTFRLAAALLAATTAASAQEVVYSSFSAGSSYASSGQAMAAGDRIAVSFTVPPGINYSVWTVEIAAFGATSTTLNLKLFAAAPSGGGLPVATVVTPALPTTAGVVAAFAFTFGTLTANTTYWLEASIATGGPATWMRNDAGVAGPYLGYLGGAWSNQAGAPPVFRLKGQSLNPDPVRAATATFTAPATEGCAEVYLEVICPGSPTTNPFTMPVGVCFAGGETPAQLCQMLADAINACGCSCWGTCPSTAPYGFRADCAGSVLRVRNTTSGLPCLFPMVCIDHVTYLTKFAAKKEMSGLSGPLRLELRGTAAGIPLDPSASNTFTVTRVLRCSTGTVTQPITANVTLAPGMTSQQVAAAVASSLAAQGDSQFAVSGSDIIFFNSCGPLQADYDVTFRSNDTGLDYAFSPPFAYSMFTFAQNNWGASAGFASNTKLGAGCYTRARSFYELFPLASNDLSGTTVTMVPNAAGGYTVITQPGAAITPPTSVSLGLADDQVSGAIPLVFPFNYPGGSTSAIHVDSNGSILLNGTAASNLGGNASALLSSVVHRIGPAMQDILPSGSVDNVYAEPDPFDPSSFLVTWWNCPNFGAVPPVPSTFQVALRASGIVEMRYLTLANDSTTNGGGCVTGFSLGGGAVDPGSSDLTVGPITTSVDQLGLALAGLTRPVLNAVWTLQTTNIPPGGVLGIQVFGLADPGLNDLTFLGLPGCGLRSSLDVLQVFLPSGGTNTSSLAIPASVSLVGANVFSTSVMYEQPAPNPFGAITSNGVRGTIGNL